MKKSKAEQDFLEECKNKAEFPAHALIGGYTLFYISSQGEILCASCASQDPEEIVGIEVNWENPDLYCDSCSVHIQPSYGE